MMAIAAPHKCAVCSSGDVTVMYPMPDMTVCRCRSCSAAFLADGASVYDLGAYEYYQDKASLPQAELYNALNEKRYRELLAHLKRYRKNGALLDVGCGIGHFVRTAAAMGWDARGIEVAPEAVKLCRANGIRVDQEDLLSMRDGGPYDVVALFEVVEHLTDPAAYLAKAAKVLRQGGALVLTTPNFNSLTRRLIGGRWRAINKEHMCYFTPSALCRLLRQTGFRMRICRTRNIEPHEILKLFKRDAGENRKRDQEFRGAIEKNVLLQCAKSSVNAVLALTQLGDSIFVIAEKA